MVSILLRCTPETNTLQTLYAVIARVHSFPGRAGRAKVVAFLRWASLRAVL